MEIFSPKKKNIFNTNNFESHFIHLKNPIKIILFIELNVKPSIYIEKNFPFLFFFTRTTPHSLCFSFRDKIKHLNLFFFKTVSIKIISNIQKMFKRQHKKKKKKKSLKQIFSFHSIKCAKKTNPFNYPDITFLYI